MSNVNLNGGTLEVCGILTISSINLNSGTIVVAKYGELTINQNLTLNNNITICNYGTLTVNGSFTFQNSNNYLINAASDARASITGTITFANNSNQEGYIVNRGHLQCGGVNVRDGTQYICLETTSYFGINGNLDYNVSSANNVFTYGSGSSGNATIRYTGNAFLSNNSSKNITSSNRVLICRGPGATQTGTGGWGVPAGNISSNCAATAQPAQTGFFVSCYTLPVEWLYHKASQVTNGIRVEWGTATEVNSNYFIVELINQNGSVSQSETVQAAGNSSRPRDYSLNMRVASGIYYIRIRQVDFDGQVNYSPYFTLNVSAGKMAAVFPNPFTDELIIETENDAMLVVVCDAGGKKLFSQSLREGRNTVNTQLLLPGIYIVQLQYSDGSVQQRVKTIKY